MARIIHKRLLSYLVITFVVLVMMSYFGFRLKGFRFQNQVQWLKSGIGLHFGRYAVAYTQGFFSDSGDGVSVELAIKPLHSGISGFRTLLLIHDGNDDDQLIVGQWRSSLIVMNGDDYSHQRKVPRITIPLGKTDRDTQLVTIVSNASGTLAYLNGNFVKKNRRLVLNYPNGDGQTRLVIANNLKGDQPWTGNIAGVALYDHALDDGSIKGHYQAWSGGSDFGVFEQNAPKLLYAFDQRHPNIISDLTGSGLDLMVPKWFKIIDKNMLSWPKLQGLPQNNLVKDIVINLLGFIPLGILLAGTLIQLKQFSIIKISVFATLISFGFSLTIEVVQIWLPSRDSSTLDLLLNSLGGWIGSLLFTIARLKRMNMVQHQIG